MESLLREALQNDQLSAEIDLDRMRTYYSTGEREPLTASTAKALAAFLLSKTGLKSASQVKPELLPKAKAALGMFTFFLNADDSFHEAVEKYSASALSKHLKLDRHLAEGPDEHRETVYRLVYLLTTGSRKFANWHLYVRSAAGRALVEAGLEALRARPDAGEVFRPREAGLPPPGQYHDQPAESVVDIFQTDAERGLSFGDVEVRRTRYGKNELPRPPPVSRWRVLAYQLTDFMVIILCVVAVIELAIQEWMPAIVLGLVVFFNVVVGYGQEMKAQKALQALETLQVPHANVVREGDAEVVDSPDLVPGDVVLLDEGCQVPADLRLVEAINLEVMEAILTGESEAVLKTTAPIAKSDLALGDIRNMCFMGTSVMRGRGVGVVTATGKMTEVGKISKEMAKTEDTQTLLQKRLRVLGKVLVAIAVVLCAVVVAITLIRLSVSHHMRGSRIFEAIETGVSLGVSVIPEGLVAVTTITMALGVQRMVKNNAIVKRLAVVESLGSITTICSDKTGTLTEGKMMAVELSCGAPYRFTGTGSSPKGDITDTAGTVVRTETFPARLRTALMVCALCNNSSIPFHEDIGEYVPVGDPTEVAILLAAEKGKLNKEAWLDQGWRFVDEVAFDSDRKCMSVLYELGGSDSGSNNGGLLLHSKSPSHSPAPESASSTETTTTTATTTTSTEKKKESKHELILLSKGAPESLVAKCGRKLSKDGSMPAMSEKHVHKIEEEALQMASRGLRVLALAFKPMQPGAYVKGGADQKLADHERDLVFLGLIGLIDPPRLEVKGAIEECKEAGIRVVMITGDHPLTAMAIAQKLGIVDDDAAGAADDAAAVPAHDDEGAQESIEMAGQGAGTRPVVMMKGSELDAYSDDDIDLLASMDPFPTVFARVSPQHKLKIVEALKQRGEICAMTGDGVNDAPAIKKASVGIAMGKTGTDLTKDAASMILMDDNFKTIVLAIHEGRVIYDNIKKFILYLLSCTSAEVYTMLLCGIIGLPVPFTAIMILWVNLVADLPPALSLGIDPPEPDVMLRRPRNPKDNIFNRHTVILLLFQGFSIAALTVLVYGLTLLFEAPDALALAYGGSLVRPFSLSESTSESLSASLLDDSAELHAEAALLRCQTLALNTITFIQLVHAFLSRSVKNTVFTRYIFNNVWLVGGVLLSAVLMVFGVYVPKVNTLLGQCALPWFDWLKILGACLVHILFVEVYKIVLRNKDKCHKHRGTKVSMWYDEV